MWNKCSCVAIWTFSGIALLWDWNVNWPSWQIEGDKVEVMTDFVFQGSKITGDSDCSHEIKKCLLVGRKTVTNLDHVLKSRDITWPTKIHISYHFSSGQVQLWELDYKEGWALKNWRFWTVVLEKIVESPLDSKEIKPVNPKGNQPWIFIGRTDAEPPIIGHLLRRADSLKKTLMLGKIEGREEEKGTTEDGREFE